MPPATIPRKGDSLDSLFFLTGKFFGSIKVLRRTDRKEEISSSVTGCRTRVS